MKKFVATLGLLSILSIAAAFVGMPNFGEFGGVNLVFADNKDTSLKPVTIPCSTLLPCITKETQEKGAGAVREYVTDKFGSSFFASFLGLSAVSATVFLIVGGLQLHFAVGNEEGVGAAKKTITWAIIGLVLSILSLALISIVSNLSFS